MSDLIAFDELAKPITPPEPFKIVQWPDPILTQVAQEVVEITPEFKAFGLRMLHTLYKATTGIGLAAPQVGALFRVIVMAVPGHKPQIMFNPKVVNTSKSFVWQKESCLSVPGVQVLKFRNKWVSVKFKDLDGNLVRRKFHGVESICFQHELDHLDGIMMLEKKEL